MIMANETNIADVRRLAFKNYLIFIIVSLRKKDIIYGEPSKLETR